MSGAGLGTGAVFLLIHNSEDSGSANVMVATSLLLPVAGAIAGYEISSAFSTYYSPSPRWSRESPRLIPVATATKDGGVLGGLVGRF
jgi:hypothetical protein